MPEAAGMPLVDIDGVSLTVVTRRHPARWNTAAAHGVFIGTETPPSRVAEHRVSGFRKSIQASIPALRRYARSLTRDAEIADDLVQDTLVRALRSEHLFQGEDTRSWLYTILTNLNRNRLRTLARRPLHASLDD